MKAYQVQYSLPCEEPENNVWRFHRKQVIHFEVPVNLPDAHNLGYGVLIRLSKEKSDETANPVHRLKNTFPLQKKKKVVEPVNNDE